MARGFNKVIIMGNLTRDPEIRYTASNKAYARFTVAVGRTWKGSNGELQEHTDFIPVVVWGPQAENCERYLSKGRPVLVEGQIRTRSYEKDGQKRYVTEVQGDNVVFLGGGDGQRNGQNGGQQPARNEPQTQQSEPFPMDIAEDGDEADMIPF